MSNTTEMVQKSFEKAVAESMGRYGDFDGVCLASIAVSLKRIADAAEGNISQGATCNFEQLAWSLGRAFEQGRRTDR